MRQLRYGFALMVVLLGVVACGATTSGAPADLTEDALKNAEYQGIYDEAVKSSDGSYEGQPFVEGGASRPTITFIEPYALGDLDGDGVDDAVIILVENSGGSGAFLFLAAVLNQDGSPLNIATQFIGDRGQVRSITIDDGQASVDMVVHGPDDPMCCPSQEITQLYRLKGDQLVQSQ